VPPQAAQGSGLALPPELHLRPCEPLPYESLEVLVNAENVWANIQAYNVDKLGFDLDEEERWLPFIKQGVYDPPVPRPFYSTGRIAPKLPQQRLSALEGMVMTKLRAEYTSWRVTRSMRMRWSDKIQTVLDEGLVLLEAASCSSQRTAQIEVDKWRGRLMAATPPDHQFKGRALSFSTTDPEDITTHIMSKYPYHEEGHLNAVFAISCTAFPHYCAVTAMWVYVAVITPHKAAETKEDKVERKKQEETKKREKAKKATEARRQGGGQAAASARAAA
jgi:hypothetical protein